jgi:2-(1,2-epoxy-1,2-dihydrophenyl)acetyl-CoA isomerase
MGAVCIESDVFSCHQLDDLAVLKIRRGAKKILTSVAEKESLFATLETVKAIKEIRGVAIIYSDRYAGNDNYRQLLRESLDNQPITTQRRSTTYQSALVQLLKAIYRFPMPIVSGLNGEIGPDTFGLNLATDLRIVSSRTHFFNHNMELGFPPSAILSFYLVQSLGSPAATDLMLTQNTLNPQEVLELKLVNRVVPADALESSCLHALRKLTATAGHAIVEARKLLQPDLDDIVRYIAKGFESALRSVYQNRS